MIDVFFSFAQAEQLREAQELISAENLNAEAARRYITTSLKREFAVTSARNSTLFFPDYPAEPQYLNKKQSVFQKSRLLSRSSRRGRCDMRPAQPPQLPKKADASIVRSSRRNT